METEQTEKAAAKATIPVKFVLEDPQALTDTDQREWDLLARPGQDLLDLALQSGIKLEHACGGVCACATCHVHIDEGMDCLSPADESEDDRVEEAPGLAPNSRLACQCEIVDDGPIVVRVPSWNRNAVKETPH